MKRVLFALALLGMAVGGASADPNILEGGAMITHYNPEYIWSENPCLDYFMYPLTACDDQMNRIDVPGEYETVVWYVIAQFGGDGAVEDKIWCGCQFGFDDYDPAIMYFLNWQPCYPPDGGLEIASPGWPGPREGTAIVSTGAPWEGNWLPMYAFQAYAYGYVSGVVQLIPDPTVAVPFGGFGNCASPPEKWDALLGGLGINAYGTHVCGYPVVEYFVCCIGEQCELVENQEQCDQMGGVFHPEWNSCDPNPCLIIAACCLFGECVLATRDECAAIGGTWYPDIPSCDPNPCMPWGACCFDCECVLLYQDECESQGGLFIGGPCDPNPCPGTPTEPTSWGSIKSLYR